MTVPTIALFGCGTWGRVILETLGRLDCRVIVIDPDGGAGACADAHGAPWHPSDSPRLGFDAAIVATPASTHFDVVSKLCDRGVPLFVEKPFTLSGTDARALVDRAGERLFPLHVWRYHPGIVAMASLATRGDFGAVKGVRTFRTNWTSPRTDVGAEWTLLPHDLTICLALLGRIPELRHAVAERSPGGVNGVLACYGSEPWFVADVSNRYEGKNRQVRLHLESAVVVLEHGEAEGLRILRGNERSPAIDTIPIDTTPALEVELRACLDYLAGGERPTCGAEEGLEIVRQVEMIRTYIG